MDAMDATAGRVEDLAHDVPRRARRSRTPAWLRRSAVPLCAGLIVVAGLGRGSGDGVAAAWAAVFGLAGTLWFSGRARQVFLFSYGVNLMVVGALWMQRAGNGLGYLLINERFFRDAAVTLATELRNGSWGALQYTEFSGAGYVGANALLFWTSSLITGTFPGLPTMTVLNAFIGATIPVAIFRLARLYNWPDPRVAYSAAWFVAACPILIFYSGASVRDICVAAGSTWFVYASARATWPGRPRQMRHKGLALLAFAFVGVMRPFSMAPLAAFLFVLLIVRTRTRLLVGAVIVLAVLAGGLGTLERLREDFAGKSERHTRLALEEADRSSLGARVLQWPQPFNYIGRFGLAIVIPMPPPIGLSPRDLLIAAGSAWWYFMIPFAWIGLRQATKGPHSAFGKALLLYVILLLVAISQTSLDLRHKTAVLPLALGFAGVAWHRQAPLERLTRVLCTAGLLVVLALTYLIWKGLTR